MKGITFCTIVDTFEVKPPVTRDSYKQTWPVMHSFDVFFIKFGWLLAG